VGHDMVELIVLRTGYVVSTLTTEADLQADERLRQLLVDAVRRDGQDEVSAGDYEMDIRYAGTRTTAA
jgi:hypothetical protein